MFEYILGMVNLDLPIYVDSLYNKLTKPTFFGGRKEMWKALEQMLMR